jgi:hypothetical protein
LAANRVMDLKSEGDMWEPSNPSDASFPTSIFDRLKNWSRVPHFDLNTFHGTCRILYVATLGLSVAALVWGNDWFAAL